MTSKAEWGLRSYQDEPDSFSWGGQNVYDVYSLSEAGRSTGRTTRTGDATGDRRERSRQRLHPARAARRHDDHRHPRRDRRAGAAGFAQARPGGDAARGPLHVPQRHRPVQGRQGQLSRRTSQTLDHGRLHAQDPARPDDQGRRLGPHDGGGARPSPTTRTAEPAGARHHRRPQRLQGEGAGRDARTSDW